MEIDELFGLPAHPLIVHIPVVLIPLALTAAALALWRPARRPAILAAAAFAVVGAAGALAAVEAGQALKDRVDPTDAVEEHADAGAAVRLPAVAFAVVAVGAAAAELTRDRTPRPWVPVAAVVVTLGVGAIATVAVVDAGHSGSTAVWEDTVDGGGGGGDRSGRGGGSDSGSGGGTDSGSGGGTGSGYDRGGDG